ncbi:MAG: Protein of unknown function (DUF1217) [Rhodobacteraceae bacterium HLUCCA24]|nr:MAG: Protein of unknown function (DUF1217) [Rhodobacteraceae bacterium HLUCCA24]
MSFQPALPLSGLAGWRFLQRTLPVQQEAFAKAPGLARDADHFRARIGGIESAEALVADRRLLTVALGAFGLQDDLANRFFIRRILEDGTTRDDALANRLADKRYAEFSSAFGFGGSGPPATQRPGFAETIIARFERQSFEIAVGAQDEAMRLALYAERDLAAAAAADGSARTKWFRVMGTPPLRQVVETALGLPSSFGQQDLDRQIEVFRDRTERLVGFADVEGFADPAARETLIRRFLLQSEMAAAPTTAPGGLRARSR